MVILTIKDAYISRLTQEVKNFCNYVDIRLVQHPNELELMFDDQRLNWQHCMDPLDIKIWLKEGRRYLSIEAPSIGYTVPYFSLKLFKDGEEID